MEFQTSGLDASLLRGIADFGFERPTPIQAKAIPPGLAGRDLLAAAMTGSGKTAAFLLPILQHLLSRPRGATRALVLTPPRELAAQILEHFEGLARHTKLRGAAVFGGVSAGPQEKAFREGVDLLVATPGRLLDHLRQPYARLGTLEVLVLDEADRMLDMGFLPDVRRVLAQLPTKRQTLFFSATMPAEVVKLSKEMLKDPVSIDIERRAAPATGITQAAWPVNQELKSGLLLELLRREELGSVIVFTRTKHRANRLSAWLEKHGVANARIHGNRSQAQRTQALADFKDHRIRVLVATDIVARGIDVDSLEHVVNFDVPNVPEDYIHRVGRTARAEATGEAFTFVAPDEEGDFAAIERAVGRKIERRTLADFDYRARAEEKLEIPIGQRLAELRARKQDERSRAAEKAQRRSSAENERAAAEARRAEARARQDANASRRGGPRPGGMSGGGRSGGNGGRSGGNGGRPGGSGGLTNSSAPRPSASASPAARPTASASPSPARVPGNAPRPSGEDDRWEVAPGIWRRGPRGR